MKTIIKIVAAFGVIIVTVILTDFIFGKVTDYIFRGKINSKQEYLITQKIDADIIFFGSSRAQRHYDTPYLRDSLGIKAFNAGEDGRSLTFQFPILTQYLKNNHPKLIVLEISPAFDGRWNDHLSILYPLANRYDDISKMAERVDPYNSYYLKSSLFRYNSNWLNEIRYLRHGFNPQTLLGYKPLAPRRTPKGTFDITTSTYLSPADTLERNVLIEFIKLCKQNNVKLVGVMSPTYPNVVRRHEVDSIFALYDVPFIDNLSFRLPMKPNEYFKDRTHLNQLGAREYTKHIIVQLKDSLKLF